MNHNQAQSTDTRNQRAWDLLEKNHQYRNGPAGPSPAEMVGMMSRAMALRLVAPKQAALECSEYQAALLRGLAHLPSMGEGNEG
jgi:hypothetical protein